LPRVLAEVTVLVAAGSRQVLVHPARRAALNKRGGDAELVTGRPETNLVPKPFNSLVLQLCMVAQDVQVVGQQQIRGHDAIGNSQTQPVLV
jgi:hypothetical protein